MAISSGRRILGLAAAGITVIGTAVWFQSTRDAAPQRNSETTVAVGPEHSEKAGKPAPEVAKAEPTAVSQATPATPPRPVAFDEVRREEDGMTIIAGRAEPGAAVRVLLDGNVINTTRADGQGKFVAITMIAPDGQGHVLSLLQIVGEKQFASADQIILAPLELPIVVAEVGTQTQSDRPLEAVGTAPTLSIASGGFGEVAHIPQTSEAPNEIATAFAIENEAALPEPITKRSTEGTVVPRPQPLSVPPIDTAKRAQASQTAPRPTLQSTTTSPEAADGQGGQPLLSEAAPLDQIHITSQAADPELKTTQIVINNAVAAPAPETQPLPEAAGPKPQIAVLKSSEDGVELINVSSLAALESVALDTISYSDVGEVQLSGRAQSETRHVQVYLNNASVVSLDVDDQGRWRGDLPNVDEGIYTLRVDEVAQDGSVTSRVETPFKRESLAVLAEAAARAEGAITQITVQKGATLWAIAQERYGDGLLYVNVFQANADAIRDPDLIYPGQVFDLPE